MQDYCLKTLVKISQIVNFIVKLKITKNFYNLSLYINYKKCIIILANKIKS